MEQLASSLQNLEKVKEHLRHYSSEVHPIVHERSEDKRHELAELALIYNLLHKLSKSMEKDLEGLATHLSAQSYPTDSKEADESLSDREKQVLHLLAKGCSYNDAATMMGCTPSTIQTYVKRIYKKLNVHSRSEAVFEAANLGIINMST